MTFGWAGRILRIDLSKQKFFIQDFKEWDHYVALHLGGRGVNIKILYDEGAPKLDAFHPANPLIFGVGPLVGTGAPCGSRFNVTARSPLTRTLGDSNAGGYFGPELKNAGYDHIVFQGHARKPVYVFINNGFIEFKDATTLWGMDTLQTQQEIRKQIGDDKVKIACIGPAGERLVRFAAVIHGLKRAAARTGMGAVMGSKNLKAVVVRGSGEVQIAKPVDFENAVKRALERLKESSAILFTQYGTRCLVPSALYGGWLATRNYQTGYFEGAKNLFPQVYANNYEVKKTTCFNCPIACSSFYEIKAGPFKGTFGDAPEFHTISQFGPNVGVDSFPAVLKANELVNRYGLDADSTGACIAFAHELYEKKVISEKDVGFPLEWGEFNGVLKMIEMIAYRKELGNTLAEGTQIAAQKIGKGADKYVNVVKGLELYGELRGRKGYALACAVSTRGADHLRGAPNAEYETMDPRKYEGKAKAVVFMEHVCSVIDSLGICKFGTIWQGSDLMNLSDLASMLSAVTGKNFEENQLILIGERLTNLEKCINVLDGYSRRNDTLPRRQLKEPCPSGPAKGEIVHLDKMLDEYYELRGWDPKTGIPKKEKLNELGLREVADKLSG